MTLNHCLTRMGKLVVVFTITLSFLLGTAVPPGIAQDLPLPDPEFHGTINETYVNSVPDDSILLTPGEPPEGAPNIVLVMLDDVGFGAAETFGGPVHTPTLEKLAKKGLKYNRFHTTALCSPTRAALLTGRNHHSTASGVITDLATGYPGYTGLIPQSTATVAQILQAHGYNTAWLGKNHNLPAAQSSSVGPFTLWPNELGFDYFYGFIGGGGETDQWYPSLYENRNPINQPSYPDTSDLDHSYNLTSDLADQAITWVQNQKSLSPDTPFFLYFAPGATHAPHQPPPRYTKKYEGMFLDGWDELQQEICANQIDMGIIPDNAQCTQRPEGIPAWDDTDSFDDQYRELMAKQMQTYAGYLEYTDEQVGRVIDTIAELGEIDNTLIIYIVGDNGGSAEGSFSGTCSVWATYSNHDYTKEQNLACKDEWGNPGTSPHYAIGWAWATNAPFRWTKQVASYFGGTRNPMVISWPKGINLKVSQGGNIRDQFLHVVDVTPTILDVVGIDPPYQFNDILQKPMAGASFANTFSPDGADATPLRDTQYFEMVGHRGIYHDGWMASSFNRAPWINTGSEFDEDSPMPKDNWELFNLEDDFSQHDNLLADETLTEQEKQQLQGKLAEMTALFESEAKKYNVYPLDDRFNDRTFLDRPTVLGDRTEFEFYPGAIFVPGEVAPNFALTDYIITADLNITDPDHVKGVILANGGDASGFSLYVNDEQELVFEYNYLNLDRPQIVYDQNLPQGDTQVKFVFDYENPSFQIRKKEKELPVCFETSDGTLLQNSADLLKSAQSEDIRVVGCGGTGYLYVDGNLLASDRIDKTYLDTFVDSFDVGMDMWSPVSEEYEEQLPFEFTGGEIKKVSIDIDPSEEEIASLE